MRSLPNVLVKITAKTNYHKPQESTTRRDIAFI